MRALTRSSVAFVLAASAAACSPTTGTMPRVSPVSSTALPSTTPTKNSPGKSSPTVDEQKGFSRSTDAFAADFYARLAKKPGNFAFSPTSIETALAMAYQGARGDTAREMEHAMHLGDDPSSTLKSAASVLDTYAAPHRGYELAFADRLFGEGTYAFDPDFLSSSKQVFGASLEKVDFLHAFEPARRKVNGFVAKATHDHIADLLPEGSLTRDTRLVLVNAIYMHANWEKGFSKAETHPDPFMTGTSSHEVPTMHQEGSFGYAETSDALVLDLPYKGGDLAMTVLLPKDANGLAAFESKLMPGEIEKLALATTRQQVDVSLPRFKAASSEPIKLKEHLSALGMSLAFDQEHGDFSGMSRPDAERLFIDDAYHKAFVEVDEEGTTAAAATAVVMNDEMATAVEPRPKEFKADHPFVYVIRDVHTNLILFVGRVADPTA